MKTTTMTNQESVTNLAFFLLEKTGSVIGEIAIKASAAEQRALFGRFLGKGTIIINGSQETVTHRIKVCFGLDWEDTARVNFRDL